MKLNIFNILKKENVGKKYVCNDELYIVKENPSGAISLNYSCGLPLLLSNKHINKEFIEAKE